MFVLLMTQDFYLKNYGIDRWEIISERVWITAGVTWSIINILNTVVSIFGIYMIFKTVNELKKLEPKLKTDLWL